MNQAALRAPLEQSKAVLSLIGTASNSAQNGAGIDRTGYGSVIFDSIYLSSGSPTGGTLTLQVQDSADNSTFANFGTATVATIASGAGALASIGVDLTTARKYVRLVSTAAPTGGSSPVVTASHSARLFGPDRLPAV